MLNTLTFRNLLVFTLKVILSRLFINLMRFQTIRGLQKFYWYSAIKCLDSGWLLSAVIQKEKIQIDLVSIWNRLKKDQKSKTASFIIKMTYNKLSTATMYYLWKFLQKNVSFTNQIFFNIYQILHNTGSKIEMSKDIPFFDLHNFLKETMGFQCFVVNKWMP